MALAAWTILSKAAELRDLYRSGASLRCLTNLAAQASGLEGGGSLCPASGRPYRAQAVADSWVFGCDDPGEHLRVPVRFLRSGQVTQVRLTLPSFPSTPGVHELTSTKVTTVLRVGPDSVSVHLEKKPWERFFVMPLAALAGIIAFLIASHFAADSHAETRKELARAPGVASWAGSALRGLGRLGLWTGCMVWAAVLSAVGTRGALYTRDITVLTGQGRALFQDRWCGMAWTEGEWVEDIQAVVPVALGKKYFRVYALFADHGRVDRRFLFTVGESEVGVVSLFQRPPVVSPR